MFGWVLLNSVTALLMPGTHAQNVRWAALDEQLPPARTGVALALAEALAEVLAEALAEVLADAGKGSGLMWDFGRTLIKQAVRS